MEQQIKLFQVFEGEFWQVSLMQQLLQEFSIPAFIRNEHMSCIDRSDIVAGGLNPVMLIVSENDYKRSIELIAEYNNNIPLEEDGELLNPDT
ncbi:hypothetical protein QFZ20_001025 [Flavobacterium sp. W4I14]|nr:hypothetical protein [Flavobacterium sp. W4I14]